MKAGVFQRIFEAVSDDADMEYAMIDGTVEVATLLEPADFEGLLADKAFDIHWIVDTIRAQGVPSYRELLLQNQGVQAHRHAKQQDRPIIRSHDLPCRSNH